ncbi:hypothetical protein Pst134EA_026923 [Puccinia striiformis f. sp. tritici]|uniref:hypothetical protein n=1 Tax=Puccinia striiformis f. sp. tritici TaxID=168172 RepID=UPI002007F2EA|nr:hypothetical protein Pst134EA_026908 [Puccinia striiformis f. sp. tritici]XP_047799478.1 hypothetical protein Pst134EA_026923 [Puccinia striiformis f. sp. tritici]KAH9450201.1 hypothetical protein Pst134EA_026908 [Puccinia striiformis f. sp. tritici]KAH9450215.1 hypothetical protein Pst134EA_026923 [Puccinia striiformis f. sp. tritici]
MSYLWSDSTNPPSSPIGARKQQEQPYPTPEQELSARPRSRASRPRTYRQATISECLNRFTTSSPLASSSSSPSYIRPTLAPIDFNQHTRIAKRLKFDDDDDDKTIKLNTDQDFNCLSEPFLDDEHQDLPPRRNRSRIIHQSTYDPIIDFESSFRKRANTLGLKRVQSLHSDPSTQTIKMWNHEYQNGHEFPFSLVFNNAAKNRAPGRPPAPEEMMATASALGTISLYNPSYKGTLENQLPITTFQGIQNGIFALAFSGSDKILGTGSGAQISEIFDIETGNCLGRLQDHKGTVKTIEFHPDHHHLILTGSRDGSIKLWDLRIISSNLISHDGSPFHSPVITIKNAHDEKFIGKKRRKGVNLPSVSSVLWSRIRDHQLYSAGSSNGVVKLWDIRKKTPFSSKAHPLPLEETIDQTQTDFEESGENENPTQRPHGISSLVTSQDGARLYTLGTDSVIRTHDGLHLSRPPTHQLSSYKHPQMISTSLYLKLSISQDDRFLANSTSTGQIFIWDTSALSNSDPVILDNAHSKEICGLDFWNNGLGSCSDDSDIKIWSYSDTQFLS